MPSCLHCMSGFLEGECHEEFIGREHPLFKGFIYDGFIVRNPSPMSTAYGHAIYRKRGTRHDDVFIVNYFGRGWLPILGHPILVYDERKDIVTYPTAVAAYIAWRFGAGIVAEEFSVRRKTAA